MTNETELPAWFTKAHHRNANVSMSGGVLVWHGGGWLGGEWHGGEWHGGAWHGGEWRGGEWRGGEWRGGVWLRGVWHDGTWYGGTWHRGTWHRGIWQDGVWHGGVWLDARIDRLRYMASLAGLCWDAEASAWYGWRTTTPIGEGRYTPSFIQPSGEYYEDDLPPAGSGTCVKGIHVTGEARALSYFDIDPSCQLWRVTIKDEDLLDADGKKCRIRGGVFEKVASVCWGKEARNAETESPASPQG